MWAFIFKTVVTNFDMKRKYKNNSHLIPNITNRIIRVVGKIYEIYAKVALNISTKM